MPRFKYRAVARDGRIMSGTMAAANENVLESSLRDAGFELIRARPVTLLPQPMPKPSAARLDDETLVTFCQHLVFLVGAGTPFLQALQDIRDHAANGKLKQLITEVCRDIDQGASLSHAFGAHTAWPPLFGAVMALAERTGDLQQATKHLLEHALWQKEYKAKMRNGLRYPLFLLVLTSGVMIFMLTQVVPEVQGFVADQGKDMPWFTQVLLFSAQAAAYLWPALLTVALLWPLAAKRLRHISPLFAFTEDKIILSLPIVGKLVADAGAVQGFKHTAMMLQAGQTLLDALRDAARFQRNLALRAKFNHVCEDLMQGTPFSVSLRNQHLLDPIQLQVLHGGERSGRLYEALAYITDQLGRSLEARLMRLAGALEPVLTITVGILLVWLVAATLLPVYDSLQTMGSW